MNRDAHPGRPWFVIVLQRTLGKRWLALPISNEQFMPDFRSQRVVLALKPDKLSLQVAYSLLKAAHL